MPQDLHELPKLRDSLSYVYIDKAIVERDENAIVFIRENEHIPVPISSLTVLMLGPGTSVTHAAMRVMAENGCMVVWCGENAMRYYAFGMGETRNSARLLRQAACCMDEGRHLDVVKRMYQLRFPNMHTNGMGLAQIRGLEGVRVREGYKAMAKRFNVLWQGRHYDKKSWDAADPLNIALSTANVCLYGLCHAAIVSLGYAPGLGFIHTGKMTSFVYDIADLYKMKTSVPAAFEAVSSSRTDTIPRTVRLLCRKALREQKVLKRIAIDIAYVLDEAEQENDINALKTGSLWDGEDSIVDGGINHSEDY